jgi:hypothetical protein
MTDTVNQEENTATAAPEAALPPSLGLADLKNVLIVIDLASSRGAFKTAEFAAVGTVYAKVQTFLEAATPTEAPAPAEAPVAEEVAEEDAEEVLQKEFSRRHKGTKFSSYVLKWTWETIKNLKDNKNVSENEIKFRSLPMLENIIFEKKHKFDPQGWNKIVDEAYKNRTAKHYEKRLKLITSKISRVDNKEYKKWLAYYELFKQE